MNTARSNAKAKSAKSNIFRRGFRRQNGSLIAEGAAGMVLISIGVVGSILLLINAGLSFYYKEKLGFVCDQTARYAASRSESSRESETRPK